MPRTPIQTRTTTTNPPRPSGSEFEPIGQILKRVIAAAGCASVLRQAAAARSDSGRVERHEDRPTTLKTQDAQHL